MLQELKRAWTLYNPRSNELDKAVARESLGSPKDLPIETRWELIRPTLEKYIETHNEPYSAGHDTFNGWVVMHERYGPDVLARGIEKGLIAYTPEYRSEVAFELQRAAILEGWNTTFNLCISTEGVDKNENPKDLLIEYNKLPFVKDVAQRTFVDLDILAEEGEERSFLEEGEWLDEVPMGHLIVKLTYP